MRSLLLTLALFFAAVNVTAAQPAAPAHTVLLRYYDVKNWLTKDNFDSASAAAHRLAEANASELTDKSPEARKMHAVTAKLRPALLKLAHARSIEAMRTAFEAVSNGMRQYVSTTKAASGDPVFLQYCPMKKAYWLSESKEVRNPYYGKKMLFCGQSKPLE